MVQNWLFVVQHSIFAGRVSVTMRRRTTNDECWNERPSPDCSKYPRRDTAESRKWLLTKKRFRKETLKGTNLILGQALSASTMMSLSCSMSLSIFSMPLLSVNVDDGQPLQAPCSTTLTRFSFSSYESNNMFPPSAATAGLTYSSRMLMICCEVVSRLSKISIVCFSILGVSIKLSSSTVPPF